MGKNASHGKIFSPEWNPVDEKSSSQRVKGQPAYVESR